MRKRIACLFLSFCGVLLTGPLLGPGPTVPDHVFRYAENQAADYPTTLAAEFFAERVREMSQGRIRIFVYPGAVLGDERSIIEQMQHGGIDFGRVNLSPLSEYDERLFVLQLPYLYQDSAHMWRVLEGEVGDAYLEGMARMNVVGLAWVDAGARNFYTQHAPVKTIADMRGLRIRVQENVLMERLVELLGAEPVQMRYGDVLAALQTGKIDGAENNYPSYYSTGHYRVAPYMLRDEHSRIPEVMLASEAAMAQLCAADRALVRAAAQEAAAYERDAWRAYEAKTLALVLDSGCEVYDLPPGELAAFQAIATQMREAFASGDGEVLAQIDALRE